MILRVFVISFVLIVLSANIVNSESTCGPAPYPYAGLSLCQVGIPTEEFNYDLGEQYTYQHENEWCWAASIEMILHYYGLNFPQEKVVSEIYGGLIDFPGGPDKILEALNGTFVDNNGVTFDVSTEDMQGNPSGVVQELNSDHPLLIGSLGHAMVNTAATYMQNPMTGAFQFTSATVRDPWPYNQSLRQLSPQEFMNVSLLLKVTVNKENDDSDGDTSTDDSGVSDDSQGGN